VYKGNTLDLRHLTDDGPNPTAQQERPERVGYYLLSKFEACPQVRCCHLMTEWLQAHSPFLFNGSFVGARAILEINRKSIS
jgi:hypothetical protein